MPAASPKSDCRPLAGRRILVTRAHAQYATTAQQITDMGGIPIPFPCLEVHTLDASLQHAWAQVPQASDILFTSVNGVQAVQQACPDNLAICFANQRIAAVGKRTAQALMDAGMSVHIMASNASQQGLIAAYHEAGLPQNLLFFRAQEGSNLLASTLQASGVRVTTIPCYQTICPNEGCDDIRQQLAQQTIDAVLLGSAKTAQHYVQRVQQAELADTPVLAVMSQQVADAADKLGLHVQLIATQANFSSMLHDLADYFSQRSSVCL